MRRRIFLKSVLGCLGLVFVPKAKEAKDEFQIRFKGNPDDTAAITVYGPDKNGNAIKLGHTQLSSREQLKEEVKAIYKEWKEAKENHEKAG